MRNKYPGICYRCGERVEAGEGHFERFPGAWPRWRTQHATCAIKHRGHPDSLRAAWVQERDERRAQGTGIRAQRARRRLRDKAAMQGDG